MSLCFPIESHRFSEERRIYRIKGLYFSPFQAEQLELTQCKRILQLNILYKWIFAYKYSWYDQRVKRFIRQINIGKVIEFKIYGTRYTCTILPIIRLIIISKKLTYKKLTAKIIWKFLAYSRQLCSNWYFLSVNRKR